MTRKGYANVSLPETLVDEIDKITNKKLKGYTSRAELVKDAVRKLLEELQGKN